MQPSRATARSSEVVDAKIEGSTPRCRIPSRRFGAALLASLLVLVACSSDEESSEPATSSQSSSSDATPTASDTEVTRTSSNGTENTESATAEQPSATDPVDAGTTATNAPDEGAEAGDRLVEHKYGSTTVTGVPERIVTIGLTDQDYVIALGFAPVATSEWFGEQPGALYPWAIEALADRPTPEVVLDVYEPNIEQIASLDPDLILGLNSGVTQEQYDLLAEIAPTVAQPAEYPDFGAPWQEITRRIGTALDREDRAEELVADVEARIASAAEENPSLDGATGMIATDISGDFFVYADGPAPEFLVSLGIDIPDAADAALDANDRAPTELSDEQLSVLDSDATVIGLYGGTTEEELRATPTLSTMDFVEAGSVIPLVELSRANTAMSFGSVLSLPIALEEMVPRLVAAADRDPTTEVAVSEAIGS